ncbi:MAG: TerB family tellurite resistance protein [Candidatus Eisenbacteria bacterium]
MLDRLRSLFAPHAAAPAAIHADPNRALKVAACALLLEMAHADDEFSPEERTRIEHIVARHFADGPDAARELIEAADRERAQATDLFQLTSVVTRHYDEGQRLLLSELLWRVVDADGRLSEHEDYLTQKLAVLLDLRPGYLAEARKRARA